MSRGLIVKIAVGSENPERMQTGLSVAATACAAGVPVSLWLAGDAVWLAVDGASSDIGAEPAELFASVLQSCPVLVCARCAQRRAVSGEDLLPGVQIQGAAAFVAAITEPDVQALVY